MNALELKKVRKNYGDFVLDDVSFQLPRGYIMGLIGPNVAGKTTIIRLIMNLIRRESGEIRCFEKDNLIDEVDIKSRIGFVYENPGFYDHLNLKAIRKIVAPFYPTWDEGLFQDLTERFELPMRKTIKKFSHGMVMKSAIAIALSHHAELIIMDEPTSGLDPIFRRELLELLSEIMQDERKSILFSTHITSDLERIADYITFIHRGRIVFSASKDEILERYGIVKGAREALNEDSKRLLLGTRLNEYGFEALTADIEAVRGVFPADVVIDKASLEDIMFYIQKGEKNAVA